MFSHLHLLLITHLLLFVIPTSSSSSSSILAACTPSDPSYDPISCYISTLTIPLPSMSFKKSGLTFTLSHLICSNFAIGSLLTQYSGPTTSTITTNVNNINAKCTGKYHVTGGIHGEFSASIADPSNIFLSLLFTPDSTQYMLNSVNITTCTTLFTVPKELLVFEGSISAWIVDLFKGDIAEKMEDGLSNDLCSPLTTSIESVFGNVIQEVNIVIGSVIEYTPDADDEPVLPSGVSELLLVWSDTPDLEKALFGINEIILPHNITNNDDSDSDSDSDSNEVCQQNKKGRGSTINGIIDKFTNDTNTVDIPLPSNSIPIPLTNNVTITALSINGLDTLTSLQLIKPNNNSTIENGIGFDRLNVTIGVMIYNLEYTINIDVNDINLLTKLFVGVNKYALSELTLNQLDLPCMMSTLLDLNVTDLSLNLNVSTLSINNSNNDYESKSDSLTDEVITSMNGFVELLVTEYSSVISDAVYGVMQGPGREYVNAFLILNPTKANENDYVCIDAIDYSDAVADYIDFNNNTSFTTMSYIINDVFGLEAINAFLSHLYCQLSTTHTLDDISYNYNNKAYGLNMSLSDFTISDIGGGSVYIFDILHPSPTNEYSVNNEIAFSNIPLDTGFTIGIDYDDLNVHTLIPINNEVSKVDIQGSVNAKIDMNKVYDLKLVQLSNLGCVISTIDTFELFNVNLHFGENTFIIGTDVVNATSSTSFINNMLVQGSIALTPLVNTYIRTLLYNSTYTCYDEEPPIQPLTPSNGSDNGSTSVWVSSQAIVSYVALVCVVLFFFMVAFRNPNANGSIYGYGDADMTGLDLDEPLLASSNSNRRAVSVDVDIQSSVSSVRSTTIINSNTISSSNSALLYNPHLPSYLRYLPPFFLLLTFFLYILSNLGIGASVDLLVSTQTHSHSFPSLFDFALANTVTDMWQAKAYVLTVLVVIASGIWPYAKLGMMMYAWITPCDGHRNRNRLSQGQRGNMLRWLDAMSKFSLVDVYVLVMMMVAFRFHLTLPRGHDDDDEKEMVGVDVLVTPHFGFYGFLAATVMSLILGQVVLAAHRFVEKKENESDNENEESEDVTVMLVNEDEDKDEDERILVSLINCTFTNTNGDQFKLKRITKLLLFTTVLTSTLTLLSIAVSAPSFKFEFGGLSGLLLASADDTNDVNTSTISSTVEYSLISLGHQIPQSVTDPNSIGIRVIQGTYFTFSLFTPFLSILLMTLLLTVKLSIKQAKRINVVAEIVTSWSAIEVFVLSLFAALLEIGQFADFIIGDKCDGINRILVIFFDDVLDGDDVCFNVRASLIVSGASCLFLGTCLSAGVCWFVLRVSREVVEEREGISSGDDSEEERLVCRMFESWWFGGLFDVVVDADDEIEETEEDEEPDIMITAASTSSDDDDGMDDNDNERGFGSDSIYASTMTGGKASKNKSMKSKVKKVRGGNGNKNRGTSSASSSRGSNY